MRKIFRRRKLNNNGSTLVMAIILISFITILASVVLSASITNIAMKRADNNSKKSFYSAEAAVDEIYAGLGMAAMDALSSAYESVAGNLVEMTDINGTVVPIEVDNATANQRLKNSYMNNIFMAITGYDISVQDRIVIGNVTEEDKNIMAHTRAYLMGFLKDSASAEVLSIGSICMEKIDMEAKEVYKLSLKDTVISYLNSEGYFATVTVDIDLDFPQVTANFAKAKKVLTAFAEYAFIADRNINFNNGTVNLGSNILAGGNINVLNGSTLNANGNGNVNIVSAGDITLDSNGNGSTTLSIAGCDIWCSNLTLKTSAGTRGSVLNVDSNSNMYVKDDLNLNGRDSNVNLGGNYYGYSYEGYSTDGNKVQDRSSALIVNGKDARLNIKTNTLMIGGHSYINFNQDGVDAYMTGEALSVKGNQYIYMVIDQYIAGTGVDGQAVHNPMSYDDWMKVSSNNTIVPIDLRRFYAYNLLDSSKPYIIKYVNDMYYVYLNFKSKTAASQYFMSVVDDNYFKKLYPTATTAQKEERQALKTILNENLVKMLGNDTAIQITGNGKIQATGAVFEINRGSSIAGALVNTDASYKDDDSVQINMGNVDPTIKDVNEDGTVSYDGFALSAIDLSNRYKLLTHICLDVPTTDNGHRYIVNDPLSSFTYKNDTFLVTLESLNKSATDNIVDYRAVKSNQYNTDKTVTGGYLVMAVDDSVVVPNTARYGIIIATGDVTVNADFSGIIITQGTINVAGNAKIDNLALNQIRGYENIKKYLYAYQESFTNQETSISNLNYGDLIKLTNWRKNEG